MISQSNPTGTGRIETAYLKKINERFARFRSAINKALAQLSTMGVIANRTIGDFRMDDSQQRIFLAFYEQKFNEILLEGDNGPNAWRNKHILKSYKWAIDQSKKSLRERSFKGIEQDQFSGALLSINPTDEERRLASLIPANFGVILPAVGLDIGASIGSQVAFLPEIHRESLNFLFTRSYENMKNLLEKDKITLRQIIFEHVRAGDESGGIRALTHRIMNETSIKGVRAELIARTEVIQAYQQSVISEVDRTNKEFGAKNKLKWVSSHDARVRDLHRQFDGKIMTTKEALKNINISPWNCRCSLIPFNPEFPV